MSDAHLYDSDQPDTIFLDHPDEKFWTSCSTTLDRRALVPPFARVKCPEIAIAVRFEPSSAKQMLDKRYLRLLAFVVNSTRHLQVARSLQHYVAVHTLSTFFYALPRYFFLGGRSSQRSTRLAYP
jgi:hypothetical protein